MTTTDYTSSEMDTRSFEARYGDLPVLDLVTKQSPVFAEALGSDPDVKEICLEADGKEKGKLEEGAVLFFRFGAYASAMISLENAFR